MRIDLGYPVRCGEAIREALETNFDKAMRKSQQVYDPPEPEPWEPYEVWDFFNDVAEGTLRIIDGDSEPIGLHSYEEEVS